MRHNFKTALVKILLFVISISLVNCNFGISPPPDIRYTIKSIIPLGNGLQWQYDFFMYGSQGEKIATDSTVNLQISRVWLMENDSTLIPSNTIDETLVSKYVFAYEWQYCGTGLILKYRDKDTIPGLYVYGTFTGDSTLVFKTPRLWLAYPADMGFKYSYNLDASSDSMNVRTMEIAAVKERFYLTDKTAGAITGLKFVDCYLYKEFVGDTINYYYYNSDYGALAYQKIYNNQIRQTYILRTQPN